MLTVTSQGVTIHATVHGACARFLPKLFAAANSLGGFFRAHENLGRKSTPCRSQNSCFCSLPPLFCKQSTGLSRIPFQGLFESHSCAQKAAGPSLPFRRVPLGSEQGFEFHPGLKNAQAI